MLCRKASSSTAVNHKAGEITYEDIIEMFCPKKLLYLQFLSLLKFEEHPDQSKPVQFSYLKTPQNSILNCVRFLLNLFSKPMLLMTCLNYCADLTQSTKIFVCKRAFWLQQVFSWGDGGTILYNFKQHRKLKVCVIPDANTQHV